MTASRIAEVWVDVVELGSFVDLDKDVRDGTSTYAEPLDAEMRRELESLITIASPYARRYPTAASLDMESAAFKTRRDLIPEARKIVNGARDSGLIGEYDAEVLVSVLDTAERSEPQGAKARTVGVQSSQNVVIKAGKFLLPMYLGVVLSGAATQSKLIGPSVDFFLRSETAVLQILDDLPKDIGIAYRLLIDGLREEGPIPRGAVLDQSSPRRPEEDEEDERS